jgi:hydrogenase maturation protease
MGNELFGDDAVGIHVVRQIKSDGQSSDPFFCAENVDFEECSVSGLAILDYIIGYDRVIIIDTIKKLKPVTAKSYVLDGEDLRHVPGPSPHYISIPQAIEIGKKLKLKVPEKIEVIAIEAKNLYKMGEGLSKEMVSAIPQIKNMLKDLLSDSQAQRTYH